MKKDPGTRARFHHRESAFSRRDRKGGGLKNFVRRRRDATADGYYFVLFPFLDCGTRVHSPKILSGERGRALAEGKAQRKQAGVFTKTDDDAPTEKRQRETDGRTVAVEITRG